MQFSGNAMPRKRTVTSPNGRVASILIVDDVEDNREMYAEYLRFVGWQVVTAPNGEEGLSKALADPPDAVVLDLTMPRMDGWAFATALRANPRTQHTRIIVLTGHALTGTEEGARKAGAHSFLSKPCLPEALAREVRLQLGPHFTRP
jgi:CheY-like chemotaxis protein